MTEGHKKSSFVLYTSQYESIKDLSDSQKAILLDSIFQYVITSEAPVIKDAETRMAFKFIKGQIDFDFDKYESICAKRRVYGKRGGEANASDVSKSKQLLTKQAKASNVSKSKQLLTCKASEPDNDNDNDNDNDLQEPKGSMSKKKKNIIKKEKKEFIPPTIEEVQAYIKEKGYNFSAQAFIDYYEADGWHYGKGARRKKMSNWKQACASWGNHHGGIEEGCTPYPQNVDDLREEDIQPNFWCFMPWCETHCPKLWQALQGFPTSDEQYQNMVRSTEGGYRMLCYIVLVLERDGWGEYSDKRGFMWVYKKYIEKNGLYKGED